MYLIVLNLILFFLVVFIIILSILYITDKSKVSNYSLYISFRKICIQIICFTFFFYFNKNMQHQNKKIL